MASSGRCSRSWRPSRSRPRRPAPVAATTSPRRPADRSGGRSRIWRYCGIPRRSRSPRRPAAIGRAPALPARGVRAFRRPPGSRSPRGATSGARYPGRTRRSDRDTTAGSTAILPSILATSLRSRSARRGPGRRPTRLDGTVSPSSGCATRPMPSGDGCARPGIVGNPRTGDGRPASGGPMPPLHGVKFVLGSEPQSSGVPTSDPLGARGVARASGG